MLKGINPLLNADVLYALRAMGHGDDLIMADTNFPAGFGGAPDKRLADCCGSTPEPPRSRGRYCRFIRWILLSTTRRPGWKSSASRTKFPRAAGGATR